jgi:hypothetical protein
LDVETVYRAFVAIPFSDPTPELLFRAPSYFETLSRTLEFSLTVTEETSSILWFWSCEPSWLLTEGFYNAAALVSLATTRGYSSLSYMVKVILQTKGRKEDDKNCLIH